MRKLVLALSVPLFSLSATAHAHFNLTAPPSTTQSTEGGKGAAPCGPDTPSNAPIAVTGGSMLKITLSETVFHPGFYRVALSLDSRNELPADNVVKDKMGNVLTPTSNGLSDTADYETTPIFPVLVDHLFAHDTQSKVPFESSVALPNVTCAKCTLQVIEFMSNHGTNGPSAGFFYHHCADLKITADPNLPVFNPNAGGAGGGSSAGAAGASAGGGGAAGASTAGAAGSGGGGASGAAGSNGGAGSGGTAAVAGSPATTGGTSAGGSSAAAAAGVPLPVGTDDQAQDSGGCSLSQRSANTVPLLSVLAGLLVLGRRRRSRRAA